MDNLWPEELGFSMAPWGYTTHAKKISHDETSVVYQCNQAEHSKFCTFKISVDPRDMTVQFVKELMYQHMDQTH